MIVAAHQPNFIPWLGYFDKMLKADLFIVVDHVQVERQAFQNRALIKTGSGVQWITVPVVQRSRAELIMHKLIDNSRSGRFRWNRKMFLTLKYAYQAAPFFRAYEPALLEIFDARWDHLTALNERFIELCREALGVRTPIVKSSSLRVQGTKSDMVLNMCREVGADVYLSGSGASRDYLDVRAFERAGIEVLWQRFQHPTYRQGRAASEFVPMLSSLDMIFNYGPRSGEILRGDGAPAEEAL